MTDAAIVNAQAASTALPAKPPPAIPLPKAIQAVAFLGFRRWTVQTALGATVPCLVLNVPSTAEWWSSRNPRWCGRVYREH